MRAGSRAIDPATVMRNLGVMIDAELSMRKLVSRVAQVCFFHLCRLRPMRARLGRNVTLTLVTSLMLLWLGFPAQYWHPHRESFMQLLSYLTSEWSAPARSRVANTQGAALAADQAMGRLQIVPPSAQSGGWLCTILPDWYADCSHWCPIEVDSSICI